MENLEDLKLLVNELENNTNKEEQIKILQTIGKILISIRDYSQRYGY